MMSATAGQLPMGMLVNMKGLTDVQCNAISGVQVGDLILVQKVAPPPAHDEEEDDSRNEDDYDDEQGGGDDDDDPGSADSEQQDDDETADHEDDAGESSTSDSSEQHSEFDAAAQNDAPPRMYVVSVILKDASERVTDVRLAGLTYSEKVDAVNHHTYHIYGRDVVHHHPTACMDQCSAATSISEIVQDDNTQLLVKPDGDMVRGFEQTFLTASSNRRCIAACYEGWLSNAEKIQDMIKDYDAPTLSADKPIPPSFQPSICPVCVGADFLKRQQEIQGTLLVAGFADFSDVFDLHHAFASRRRELGYHFRQFDEREWAYSFEDMLSEDEEDDYDRGDYGRWQQWDEAMDPNANPQFEGASDVTIAALPRVQHNDISEPGEHEACEICMDKFNDDSVLVKLSCDHVDVHEECIVTWLKQSNKCPICRRMVAATDSNEQTLGAGDLDRAVVTNPRQAITEQATGQDPSSDGGEVDWQSVTRLMDGEDAVMSDAW